MHSEAFWAENSHFEFSWQAQLLIWLHGVLSDSGGGGRERCCESRAGMDQSENRSSRTRFQFQIMNDSTLIFAFKK